MNKVFFALITAIVLVACNDDSKQQLQQLQTVMKQDSIMAGRTQQKDSEIVSYVKTLDEIQNNIDSIKAKEKIITASGNEPPHTIINDIKLLDSRIVMENRRIYQLEKKLKKEDKKDADLEKVIKHLTKELAEKDVQIADLQTKLAESNTSLKNITSQFNDSIAVIHKQREEISAMRSLVNTVYYTSGTFQELKKQGVITKEGSIAGIGGAAKLTANVNESVFAKSDMNGLKFIPLRRKFRKMVTNHPTDSYKISGLGLLDTVYINDPVSFWYKSKYLVIEVK
jgi:chromosome segregation ATPase